jgi:hypothetical protein
LDLSRTSVTASTAERNDEERNTPQLGHHALKTITIHWPLNSNIGDIRVQILTWRHSASHTDIQNYHLMMEILFFVPNLGRITLSFTMGL